MTLSSPSPKERTSLLAEGEAAPASVVNPGGRRDCLLVGDHAGNVIPARLGDLGLPATELTRHIAWDIGVRVLGEQMARVLDATFVHQLYSRLVIDSNREPESSGAVLAVSDGTPIPGNTGLNEDALVRRRVEIHEAYHARIATEVATRKRQHPAPLIVALHSFTPALGGVARPWQIGVLHDAGDTRTSHSILARMRREGDLVVGDNEPYKMDGTDYTIPRHAYGERLPYLELEFRNDLLATTETVHRWAVRVASWIEDSIREL